MAREDETGVIKLLYGRSDGLSSGRLKLQNRVCTLENSRASHLCSCRKTPGMEDRLLFSFRILNKQASIVIEDVLVRVLQAAGPLLSFWVLSFGFPMWGLLPLPPGSSDDTWMNNTGSVVWG